MAMRKLFSRLREHMVSIGMKKKKGFKVFKINSFKKKIS